MTELLAVAAGLGAGIGLIVLFSGASIPSGIPTIPQLTEEEVFEIMKADIHSRVGNATVVLYMRHPINSDNTRALPLIYFSSELGRQYGIDGNSNEITYSCVPSRDCPINIAHSGVEISIDGTLVYFLDGAYSGKAADAPAFYFIDAMNGQILWSDIGIDEDIDREPHKKWIAIQKCKAVVQILEGASIEGSEAYLAPQTATVVIGINNTVLWINEDTVPHTITTDDDYRDPISGAFDSRDRPNEEGGPFVMPQGTYEFTFTEPGAYYYHHEPHPWITGTIIVEEQKSIPEI